MKRGIRSSKRLKRKATIVTSRRAGWIRTEILMAMIESGKSKRVRRKLLQDQLTLAEIFKYTRGLESADQHATNVENQTPRDVTVKP